MNQRIRELAKQAEIKFEATLEHSGIDTAVITPADLKKFAKLLIQECANVLREESERLYALSSKEEDELFASNFEICAEKCVHNEVAIKHHFGVWE